MRKTLKWKTRDPVYLAPGVCFTFLGVTIEKLPHGILLHQNTYTELTLEEHQSSIPTRPRWTAGEAEHFRKGPPELSARPNQPWALRVDSCA